jgi:hypothetical protein
MSSFVAAAMRILFLEIYKGSLQHAVSVSLSEYVTHYDPLSGFSYNSITTSHEDPPFFYPPRGDVLSNSVGLNPGNL